MYKLTGGPAFPRAVSETTLGGNFDQEGMTLRDYFAARAMQSILQDHYYKVRTCAIGYGEGYGAIAEEVSEHAYEMADAMLKARK